MFGKNKKKENTKYRKPRIDHMPDKVVSTKSLTPRVCDLCGGHGAFFNMAIDQSRVLEWAICHKCHGEGVIYSAIKI